MDWQNRTAAMIVIAVLVMAGSVAAVSRVQQSAADKAFSEMTAATGLLVAMLDQETGLRGYTNTGDRRFLEPYEGGRKNFEQQLLAAQQVTGRAERLALAREVAIARRWQNEAETALIGVGRGVTTRVISNKQALQRKQLMDRFRAQNLILRRLVGHSHLVATRVAGELAVGLIVVLSLGFGTFGYFVVVRRARHDHRYRLLQADFVDHLQGARNENEANQLLKRHIELAAPNTNATVLRRNSSDDRLEAATPLQEDSPLAESLKDSEPEDCLAIRYSARHAEQPNKKQLVNCALCGNLYKTTTCVPALVGGRVIGSVLVECNKPLSPINETLLYDSVAQSAPVHANLRMLAIAETRAATDPLSGLPNKRAIHETLQRMLAQAERSNSPLTAILFDLDHFKGINDVYGHGKGDEVLAAVSKLATEAVRTSDFVGRFGGEEFIILLADTDTVGGEHVAEKVRAAFSAITITAVTEPITASLGVATFPDHATTAAELLRAADRMLYKAKARGRNCVCSVGSETARFSPIKQPKVT